MKVVIFSKSSFFVNVAKITCSEVDWISVNIYDKSSLDDLLKNQQINLVIIDCDTFRPVSFNILEYIHNINKNTHCLVVETSIHEIDKDTLLAQISKQCMLQEIYFYQQFVKLFCTNYWNESEKKILQKEHIQKNILETEESIINYSNLHNANTNEIEFIKEQEQKYFPESITLGFLNEVKENIVEKEILEDNSYEGLEPTSIKILEYFKSNINKPISIKSLCTYIWGENNILKRNAIYVYIRKIRIFLEDDLDIPKKLIKSRKGFYILKQL